MKMKHLKQLYVMAVMLPGITLHAQSVMKTMKRLPDTGAGIGYSAAPGEDGEISIQPPFFIIHGNGTITDTVTGLMWQQGDGGEMTIENARLYCDTLTLGGYTDWRLPELRESFSILNHRYANPALDAAIFTKTAAEYWWTADVQANDTGKIWVTNAGGGAGNHPKTETVSAGGAKKFHVRALRSVYQPLVLKERFSGHGNGTVTDGLTGLIWRAQASPDSVTWENALWYADSCTFGGFTDWRLPNIKELQSMTDLKLVNPCLNKTYFQPSGRKYWSSTTLPNQTQSAWYLDNRYGITTYDNKTRKNCFFLVRSDTVAPALNRQSPGVSSGVYPNPFADIIYLNVSNHSVFYELADMAGRVLMSGRISGQLSLSHLPEGCYLLRLSGENDQVIRIIKQSDR